jgi:hypothetical protein
MCDARGTTNEWRRAACVAHGGKLKTRLARVVYGAGCVFEGGEGLHVLCMACLVCYMPP